MLIAVNPDVDLMRPLFRETWETGVSRCDDCMTWRRDEPIWVGRRSVVPLDRIWARVRFYI